MKEIERIIREQEDLFVGSEWYFQTQETIDNYVNPLAKAIEQYVIKARIQECNNFPCASPYDSNHKAERITELKKVLKLS